MALARVYTRAKFGLDAPLVTIEVHLSNGLPGLSLVGLPETAVKESKERVRSAILNSGFEFPNRRITINLAPAELPKHGGRFDLAIAVGILYASNQLQSNHLDHYEWLGELSLSGDLQYVDGIIPAILSAKQAKRAVILPQANHAEAALCSEIDCFTASHLNDVCAHIHNYKKLNKVSYTPLRIDNHSKHIEIQDIKGQHHAKKALTVAASGGHHLLMIGPPGTGKTLLASCLPGLLPPLHQQQALEVAAIQSLTQQGIDRALSLKAPFRTPHHNCSGAALIGGGSYPKPGEVSLAHNGILFLDELPEFSAKVLDNLREPLESKCVNIARARQHIRFPAAFQLVAALNPCPCGYYSVKEKRCDECSDRKAARYQSAVSGPLLDRIDLHIEVPPIKPQELFQSTSEKTHNESTSSEIRQLVTTTRDIQLQRAGVLNADMTLKHIEHYCQLERQTQEYLYKVMDKLRISARSLHKILKVSRTVADLDNSDQIKQKHIIETLSFRRMDRIVSMS